jgi:diguanylate cyclase (GGDEF)-like protein
VGSVTVPEVRPPGGAVISDALRAAWDEQRPKVMEGLELIERLLVSVLEEEVHAQLHDEGVAAARALAGSLDAFRFPEAAALATRLVESLETVPALGPEMLRLSELVVELRWQLEDGPPVATAPSGSGSATPPPEPPVVLLIGQDPDLLGQLTAAAAAAGFHPLSASSREEVRSVVDRHNPAAVLLDLHGAVAEEQLSILDQLDDRAGHVPSLVLSESARLSDRIAAVRRGVVGFLDRRSPTPQLMEAVRDQVDPMRNHDLSVLALSRDPSFVETAGALLSPTGLLVRATDDPGRLFHALAEDPVDLVFLDTELPGVTGADLCRALRSDPRWSSLPVMLFARNARRTTIRQLLEAGADDVLLKPIVADELVTRVENRLQRIRAMRRIADTDELTGLWNRRRSLRILDQHVGSAARSGQPVTLAVLDVDHFKAVNDRLGHPVGDEVLRRLGHLLSRMFRSEDVTARWGGEEFVVGMYGVTRADALRRMRELQAAVRAQAFTGETGEGFSVTVSAGVAQYPDDGDDVMALYRAADAALYRAKEQGRDMVVVSGDDVRPVGTAVVDVVLVEGDELLANLVLHALRTRGYSTHWLRDGQEAASRLTGSLRARVVLLDRNLPGLNGLAVLKMLGEAGLLRSTRVLMLMSQGSEQDVLEALQGGAADQMSKPFSIPVLMQRIQALLA